MGELEWYYTFMESYNIVKLIAVLFILGQLIALRNRDPKLSLHFQYSVIATFTAVYLVNYILFVIAGNVVLFSTLLIELTIALGFFAYPIVKFMDRNKKEVNKI